MIQQEVGVAFRLRLRPSGPGVTPTARAYSTTRKTDTTYPFMPTMTTPYGMRMGE